MEDDDGFGSDVDCYVEEEDTDAEDAVVSRRRSSRAELAAKADEFLRRHSGSGDVDGDAGGAGGGGDGAPRNWAGPASSAASPPPAAGGRRQVDSVRRDKDRLQKFAAEAAKFLDAAYDNDEGLLVEDGRGEGMRSSENFRAKRRVELDKARLERFSEEAEAFIDAAYADGDGGNFIEEEALSPTSTARGLRGGRESVRGEKERLQRFHTQAMSFLDASVEAGASAEALGSGSSRLSRRISSRRVQRDKEQLEEHYREAMAFLDRAEAGEGIVEERELEKGALDRVRLKVYAEEAMNFLENAFVPDGGAGKSAGGRGPLLAGKLSMKSRDKAIEDLAARAAAARARRLRGARADSSHSGSGASMASEDAESATDDEQQQIAHDRAEMERFYDEDDFGEDAVVEETLSDTSGGTDRGLFARAVGGEGVTPSASDSDRDDWGGEHVQTDDEFCDNDPALSSSVDQASMRRRAQALDREIQGNVFNGSEVQVAEESDSSKSGDEEYEDFAPQADGDDDHEESELPAAGTAASAVAAAMVSGGGAVAATAKTAVARSRGISRDLKADANGERRSVVAAELPPELPDFLESPMAGADGARGGDFESKDSHSKDSQSDDKNSDGDGGIQKRRSSVMFSELSEGLGNPDSALPGGSGAFDDDCLVQLLLEGSDAAGKTNEWSEVPLEKSFYRSVPRGATIKLRGRPSSAVLDPEKDMPIGQRSSVASAKSSLALPEELFRVQQERDVVMAALEDIVNERSRMAAQIAEMKKTVALTFGRAKSTDKDGVDSGEIDVASELKEAYSQFQSVIRECEATVNVLEGHIAEGEKTRHELEASLEQANARISKLERDLQDFASEKGNIQASGESEVKELRRQLAQAKDEARDEASRLGQRQRAVEAEAESSQAELKRLAEMLEQEKSSLAKVVAERDLLRKEKEKLEQEADAARSAAAAAEAAAAAAAKSVPEQKSNAGSGHLWAQLTEAREAAELAQKGQERAERRVKELQAIAATSTSSSSSTVSARGDDDAVLKAVREKDAEIAKLRLEFEKKEASKADDSSHALRKMEAKVKKLKRELETESNSATEALRQRTAENETLKREIERIEAAHRVALANAMSSSSGASPTPGPSVTERSLKADLGVKTRRLEEVQQRLDVLECEFKSVNAAKKRAEAEAELAKNELMSNRAVNNDAEVAALQSKAQSLQQELDLREGESRREVEEAEGRAAAAEKELSRLTQSMIESQQQAERAIEAERRSRKRAESQRDTAQQELKAHGTKEASSSSGGRGAAAESSLTKSSSKADGKSELVKSPSKRGLGGLIKSSSKKQIGTKKKEKSERKSGRVSSGMTSSAAADESVEKKKSRRLLG